MPILPVSWFGEASSIYYLAGLDVDGVESYRARLVPAGTSLALNLEPPFVGQSAVKSGTAP